MKNLWVLKSALAGGASVLALMNPAAAKMFNVSDGDLATALASYTQQSDVQLIYSDSVRGHKSRGAKGDYTDIAALTKILQGTGFTTQTMSSNAVGIVPQEPKPANEVAQAAPRRAPAPPPAQSSVETVVVTAQHKSEDIQQVPIAVTALSQKDLTDRQIAGGPDLVKEVPNLTFSKTNFSGYNLQIRGIGTQAISVTTDPAVAVAFNGIPFIRNHFFEQEFFDLDNLEVLRGPQGTLYGRNATAGVVNVISAKPTDTYEAMLSADIGNYNNRRLEGMINIPIVGDTLDLRVAGEWTKRDGYSTDTLLNTSIDGRDLWSGRVSLGWKPSSDFQADFVWEHFSEDDDRLRSGKQICKTAQIPTEVDGVSIPQEHAYGDIANVLSQGCTDTSLYSPNAFQVPNGYTLGYGTALAEAGVPILFNFNVYGSTTQSSNLRDIESTVLPRYRAKNDTLELNADWTITPSLTLTSQTGYNNDFLYSTEDYNRFDSAPGLFTLLGGLTSPDPSGLMMCNGSEASICGGAAPGTPCTTGPACETAGVFCDPQLGCSDRLVLQDLSTERAWQLSQEFRLASSFSGPLNFSVGANALHYETLEDYYVFVNTLSLFALSETGPGHGLDNSSCLPGNYRYTAYTNDFPLGAALLGCDYTDPNPLASVNGQGHNYFLSQNPYVLNSYAEFGELYYNITNDLKLTTGLRFTEDQKHFDIIPSNLIIPGYGYPQTGNVDQQWNQFTGREVAVWTPDLSFSDKSLFYASYSHGYKAGGANPPGAFYPSGTAGSSTQILNPIHPLTFKPEFIEAIELGTKNSFLDNSLTLNGDIFYYNYQNYQISEIVDRTAINNNYDAHVEGAELEANWEPIAGLKFGFAQGLENSGLAGGDESIDLMDRTGGNPNYMVVKPAVFVSSNCIIPTYVVAAMAADGSNGDGYDLCSSYVSGKDPITGLPYVPNPTVTANGFPIPAGYPGFNIAAVPNNGEGIFKQLGGNQLPNAPHFTTSLTAEYSMPVSDDWAATLHADFYWQSQQWARVFEDPIDKIHGYSTTNLSLILTSANGWQVIGYVKNVFDTTAITGTFLNSDDSGLTTNVFMTDPRLYGIRITKNLDEADGFWGSGWSGSDIISDIFSDTDNGKPPLWIELGGQLSQLMDARQLLELPFTPSFAHGGSPLQAEQPERWGFEEDAKVSFEPEGTNWIISAAVQYGRTGFDRHQHLQTANKIVHMPSSVCFIPVSNPCTGFYPAQNVKFADTFTHQSDTHTIIDYMAGKDVGLGMFGINGSSVLSGGVRVAQFVSKSGINLHADPDVQYPTSPITNMAQKYQFKHTPIRFHNYAETESRSEKFDGAGPQISWNASAPVAQGGSDNSVFSVDWGANFAVLFGRQKTRERHNTSVKSYYLTQWASGFVKPGQRIQAGHFQNTHTGGYHGILFAPLPTAQHTNSAAQIRSREVTVPNLGGFIGISYKYNNAKVSFGYRADDFLGVLDGGADARKTYDRGFFGPFANISIGLGG